MRLRETGKSSGLDLMLGKSYFERRAEIMGWRCVQWWREDQTRWRGRESGEKDVGEIEDETEIVAFGLSDLRSTE